MCSIHVRDEAMITRSDPESSLPPIPYVVEICGISTAQNGQI